MASTTLTSNSTAAVALTSSNDTFLLAAGFSLVTNGDAVTLAGSAIGRNVLVDGRIASSRGNGIELGSSPTGGAIVDSRRDDILIGSAGGIMANGAAIAGNATFMSLVNDGSLKGVGSAVSVTGAVNSVLNRGNISGVSVGVFLQGDASSVTNSGELSALGIAVLMDGDRISVANSGAITAHNGAVSMQGSDLSFKNSGVITASVGTAVAMGGDTGASARIVNSGTIQGSINETLGNTTLTNTGVITGDIDLGAGNDTLRLLSGSVTGEIKAGDGDDLIILGPGEFDVSGGAGTDTLSAARNTVLGLDIEKLILRGGDDLRGTGNSDANTLTGNRGDNTLKGLGGRDILNGGRGDDILIGGSATDGVRDTFVFSLDCGADKIRGYQLRGAGDDRIDLSDFAENGVFDDFADLKANFMRQSGEDVIIDLPGDDQVTIEKVALANFRDHDFIL
jgi:Ca2+-binding RTX toxin-like protein